MSWEADANYGPDQVRWNAHSSHRDGQIPPRRTPMIDNYAGVPKMAKNVSQVEALLAEAKDLGINVFQAAEPALRRRRRRLVPRRGWRKTEERFRPGTHTRRNRACHLIAIGCSDGKIQRLSQSPRGGLSVECPSADARASHVKAGYPVANVERGASPTRKLHRTFVGSS
jgi:post-segregation antitoxin (ccd killing protein)